MAVDPIAIARVSNQLRDGLLLSNIQQAQAELLRLQTQISTGLELNRPSVDPSSAAGVLHLQRQIEQLEQFQKNIAHAVAYLNVADAALADISDVVIEAEQIALENTPMTATADQRAASAQLIDGLIGQLINIGNRRFEGTYIFGGQANTTAPFAEVGEFVGYLGDVDAIENRMDADNLAPFTVTGEQAFGALSSQVQGWADLDPVLNADTRLADVEGYLGKGVRLGTIRIRNGLGGAYDVDLAHADTIGDVLDAINASGSATITAAVSAAGDGITLSTSNPAEWLEVEDLSGGTTAVDLGIAQQAPGAGLNLVGHDVNPLLTETTLVASLNGGAGIDTSGLRITNAGQTFTVQLATATTVGDLLNAINFSDANVRASIDRENNAIDVLNQLSGTAMMVAENGGSSAADLGIRSLHEGLTLAELNNGRGVRIREGADDLRIVLSDGSTIDVSLDGAQSLQDVLDAINNDPDNLAAGSPLTAGLRTDGNGILLTDTLGGPDPIRVEEIDGRWAAADLGIHTTGAAPGSLAGEDVMPITADGVISHLIELRDALLANDTAGITEAGGKLEDDHQRAATLRGVVGVRTQMLENRSVRTDEEILASQTLVSELADLDFAEALSKFQTLQATYQASLTAAAQIMTVSLLDFLQ
jgi:flagellar hook-associated protein 3 FlgL